MADCRYAGEGPESVADEVMTRLENIIGIWVIRHRWWILAISVLLAAVMGSGACFLTFSSDVRMYFSRENPELQAFEALENTYAKEEHVFLAIAPESGNVFTGEAICALAELTEASWRIHHAIRVDSLINFQHTRAEEDGLVVENLVQDPENLTDSDLDRVRAISLSDPALVNRIVSPRGHVAGVNVRIAMPGNTGRETGTVTTYVEKMGDDFRRRHPDIDLHVTGSIIIDAAFREATQNDFITLIPVMYLVLIIIMGLTLRSFSGTLATFTVIGLSMATGIGIAGWLGITLSATSVNAPTIILTLSVADSVHILATIFQQMRLGKSKQDAIVESLRVNLSPVFVTSITTAIGFLSMNFSDAPPFHDLGNIVAIGVVSAFMYSITVLPALVAVLPIGGRFSGTSKPIAFNRLADFVIKRRSLLFWTSILAMPLLAAGIFRIELNDDFVKYFSHRFEFRRGTDFIEKNLTGFNCIEYSLQAGGGSGGINDPTFLKTVDAFSEWYRQQPKVVHVSSITDIMKRLNRDMHGGDNTYYAIPETRELAAQYLLLYEMSLPFGLDLNGDINIDKSAIRMVVRLKETSTREVRQMDARAQDWLKAHAPRGMYTDGTGMSIMFAHISERNIKSMLGVSFGALILISLILITILGSIKFGLLSLIPNLTPTLMAFGIWGMAVGQVGLVISILATLTIGIVVDDTVHFMSKYLRARREYGMTPADAVRFALNTVGTAMWVTTVVLVAGFLVLALSGFVPTAVTGLMTALTITLALILDFIFLPTLLMKVEEGRK